MTDLPALAKTLERRCGEPCGIRCVRVDPRIGCLRSGARGLRPPNCLLPIARLWQCRRALVVGSTPRPEGWSAWLAVYGRVHGGTTLPAFSSALCASRHTSISGGGASDMNQLPLDRVFNIGLWLAGFGHFVILLASFQVPFRLKWREDLRSLMPFNRKLLWVQGGFTVLLSRPLGRLPGAPLRIALRRPRGTGVGVLHRHLLGGAYSCRRLLLLASRLAQGEAVCDRSCAADQPVCLAGSMLHGIGRVARVAARLTLKGGVSCGAGNSTL